MFDNSDVNPCPWCGARGKTYTSGSYVEGWFSFAECSNHLGCGARGPAKRTKRSSNEEWETRDKAVKAWNTIAKG